MTSFCNSTMGVMQIKEWYIGYKDSSTSVDRGQCTGILSTSWNPNFKAVIIVWSQKLQSQLSKVDTRISNGSWIYDLYQWLGYMKLFSMNSKRFTSIFSTTCRNVPALTLINWNLWSLARGQDDHWYLDNTRNHASSVTVEVSIMLNVKECKNFFFYAKLCIFSLHQKTKQSTKVLTTAFSLRLCGNHTTSK